MPALGYPHAAVAEFGEDGIRAEGGAWAEGPQLRIYFIDVDQADATLIVSPLTNANLPKRSGHPLGTLGVCL